MVEIATNMKIIKHIESVILETNIIITLAESHWLILKVMQRHSPEILIMKEILTIESSTREVYLISTMNMKSLGYLYMIEEITRSHIDHTRIQ